MSWADEIADEALIDTPVEVHLYLEQKSPTEFREPLGYGYKPQTVRAKKTNGGIVYEPAVFVFSGPAGDIRGVFIKVGGVIRDAQSFVKSVPVVTPGSKLTINGSIVVE